MKKLAVILLILSGCASTKIAPDGRMSLNGFSVMPPEGEEWSIVNETPSKIIFGKKLEDEYPVLATAMLIDFPIDTNDEKQFVKTIASFRELYVNPDEYEIISHNEEPAPNKGAYCTKYIIKLLAPESEREQYGFTCRHPNNKNAVVDFNIAKKGEDTSDETIIQTAAKFLSSVQFEMFDEVK